MDETQPITFRLPADLYEWLRREAFETREPMNTIAVEALAAERGRRGGSGREVVHRDGDPRNNDPANLELKEGP
jgi:hypothetical protein